MPKSRASRGILLTSNLPQLQNLIKRDPEGYREEFLTQHNHYLSLLRLHTLSSNTPSSSTNNDKSNDLFADLITFCCQVSQCYPEDTKDLPAQLRGLLLGGESGSAAVGGDLRRTAVKNLVMMRNKEIIDSIQLLQTLLPLLPTVPSNLRGMIRHTILTDIKTSNLKTKNHRLNRVVQSLLFGMIESGMGAEVVGDKGRNKGKAGREKGGEAMWAVMMVKELWRKGIWKDAKTVSIVALATFHPNTKVQSAAMHFFLGSENEDEDDSDDEPDVADARRDVRKMEHRAQVGHKNRKKVTQLEGLKKEENRIRKKKVDMAGVTPNFPALELLHDPQTFGEKLYDNLHKHDKIYSLDHKILIMQLLSRVMGSHKLCILGFYSYIIKYLTYHQLQVTLILVSLAQSVHDLTPPDVLTPAIKKIAGEFVHPGVGAEVIAAGLNAIREVCRRQPWGMEEDLLGDLIEYRKSKDKGVVTASRGLLQLFREVNPGMLKRRERGKAAAMGLIGNQVLAYGHTAETPSGIEGIELLEAHLRQQRKAAGDEDSLAGSDVDMQDVVDEADEAGWDKWDAESDDDSDSSGWQSVSSGDEDLDISDSEDETDRKRDKREKREKKRLQRKGLKKKEGEEESEDEGEGEDEEMDDGASVAPTEVSQATKKLSLLAQQKILTPADFALLNELRLKAAKDLAASGGGSAAKRKLAALEASKRHVDTDESDRFLTDADILGPRKKAKATWEERMESIQKGREGREKYGSMKGKKKKDAPSSSTNKEKAKNKPLMMAVHSDKVMQKKKASLRDKQIRLRAAIDKRKKQFH
ncbi:protein SDA1 [Cryptococcus wingfieldii CBS 7118]|uniref:Protein SDA1 n=1 Tax=Cryptococcus wingfieldii CBS 7118 TaxID=1295528 RepID=A0A1E3J1D7_9TREE|nr:protein SDA1 [Cryptococcus wingfieldii CBS 7118]ODN94659.1 protein SDA1 [Cryptococcus wingfieldii CBS 7118]